MNRRTFLKTLGITGSAALGSLTTRVELDMVRQTTSITRSPTPPTPPTPVPLVSRNLACTQYGDARPSYIRTFQWERDQHVNPRVMRNAIMESELCSFFGDKVTNGGSK